MWLNFFDKSKQKQWLLALLIIRVLFACFGYIRDERLSADLLRAGDGWHEAVVTKVSHPAENSSQYILRLDSGLKVQLFQNTTTASRPAYLIYGSAPGDYSFLPGDRINVKLRLSEPLPPRNPGNFNEAFYFFSQDVQLKAELLQYSRFQAETPQVSAASLPQRWCYLLREHLSSELLDRLGRTEGSLAAAMLLGNERFLDKDVERSFRQAGLAHVLVVSGGNVAILMLLFGLLLEKTLSDFRLRCVFLLIMAVFFASICAWDASVTRAVLMYVFSVLALYFKRPSTPLRNLLYAAIFMFFVQDRSIFRIGYLMSTACSFFILRYAPRLQQTFERLIFTRVLRHPKRSVSKFLQAPIRALITALALTLSAQLAVFPFNVYLHSHVGPFQVLINLPAGILVVFITSLGCVLLPMLLISPLAALWLSPFLIPLTSSLRLLSFVAEKGAQAPLAFIADRYMLLLSLPVYLFLFCAWLPRLRPLQRRLKILYVSAAFCLLSIALLKLSEPDFRLSFIDVGQGSAVLLHSKSGQSILYDCGPPSAAAAISNYCKSLGIEKLDLLIISHMHEDHYGSFEKLAEELKIEAVLLPDDTNVDKEHSREERAYFAALANLRSQSKSKGIQELRLCAGSTLELGGMRLNFINTAFEAGSMGNEGSCLLSVELNGRIALLLGDMTSEHWPLINTSLKGEIPGVIQFPHHGSKDGLPVDLKHLQADAVVMQMAPSNRYGHPHLSVLKSLETLQLPYFRSDLDACIEVRIKAEVWTVETYHNKRKMQLR